MCWLDDVGCWHGFLLLVRRLGIVAVVAGAGAGQLEGLDGEWEVLIIGVVDQESVVDVLLETLGLVARWDQGAGLSSSGALLNPGGLGEGLVVGLDSVDDDSQLAVGNDGYPGHVGSDGGAEVGLLDDLLQSVHAVVSVGQHVLIDGLDSLVVILKSSLNLIGGVLRVLDTPGLGVANGALGLMVWLGGVVRLRLMIGSGVVDRFMIWGGVMDGDWLMVGSWCGGVGGCVDSVVDRDLMDSVVDRHLMVGGGGSMDHWGGAIHSLRGVDGGGVVDWLHWAIDSGGGGVAIDSSVDWSSSNMSSGHMVSSGGHMDWSCSLGIGLSLD